jgi:hypothetical protein
MYCARRHPSLVEKTPKERTMKTKSNVKAGSRPLVN